MSTNPTRTHKCVHPYPELLRLRDERKADGTFVRVLDCAICGRYEIPLDIDQLEQVARLQLQFLGESIGIREEKVAEIRDLRRAELRSRTTSE
ncbi:MAG: hypothetical protein DWI57_04850 [Chloroflexi bacterium]|nr:MAG: hypothetical protein DWI57_04850 [Chloroflexota bacterium]